MSFKFKLEALRRYRNFQEDLMQKELSEAQRDRDREVDRLESLIEKRHRAEQSRDFEQKQSTNGPHMALYDYYLKRISGQIAAQRQRLMDAEALCREKMGALLQAMQNRKTMDKLKEKDLHAYMENLSQNEQKFLNEIAINQFARNNL
ncbi:MAG: flagellar export protein FliJ [Desulfobacteraceae bacterium]|jgi:flagellar FliJ protein